jgi:TetR/AcrR family transcriptional repressor of nem operon
MKVSKEQVARNRIRILDAAGKLFRAKGFDAVTVAEVMQAAGLTHGGFYGYFKSKEDLIAESLAHMLSDASNATAEMDLLDAAAEYLSARHRDDLAGGCAVAALASEGVRQAPAARRTMTASLRRQIDRLARTAPGADEAARRRAAIASWAAMVGAVTLARISDDRQLSDEVLEQTRAFLSQQAAPRKGGKA